MTDSVNPYQPPVTEQFESQFAGRLLFEGTIEAEDYCELLASTTAERISWVAFESPIVVVGVPLMVAFFIYQISLRPLPTIVGAVSLLILFLVLQRKYNRRAITQRELALHPDLLGPAQGEVTGDGVLFFDGTHYYWFGPSAVFTAMVSSRGMRIPVDANPYRYLALTRRLFEAYDESAARRILAAWKEGLIRGKAPSMALWDQIGTPPDDAVRLRISDAVSLKPGIAPPVVIGLKDFVALGTITAAAIYNFSRAKWTLLAMFGFIGCIVMLFAIVMQRVAQRKLSYQLVQDGWISAESLAMHHSTSGFRVPTRNLNLKLVDSDRLAGNLHSRPFEVHRSMLVDPNDWERLCALFA